MMDLVKRLQRSNGKLQVLKETWDNNIDRNQLFERQCMDKMICNSLFLIRCNQYSFSKDLELEEKEKKKEKVKYFENDEDAESSTSSDDDDDEKSDEEGSEAEEEEESKKEDENEETSEEEEEEDSEEEENDKAETSEEEKLDNKEGKHKEVDEEKDGQDDEKMEEEEVKELEENEESSDEEEQEDESEDEEPEEKNEANQGEASTCINDTKELKPSTEPALKINHFSHHHSLNIFQLTKKFKGNCNACGQELLGTVYICKTCESPFHYGLHKACAELPPELQHPLHPQHSLTLLHEFPHSETSWFLCDECREFSAGFVYLCLDCQFKLDVKCAVLAAPEIGSQDPKSRKKETKLLHFSHNHILVLGNLVHRSLSCLGCDLPIFGPSYCCLDCLYTLHESCLRTLPQQIQHPFHLPHHLVAFPEYSRESKCHACKMDFQLGFPVRDFIRYGCLQCELDFHFVCVNSLRRALKSNSHTHNLYYLGTDNQMFLEKFGQLHKFNFMCSACSEMCNGRAFYRCVECAINFHLKCVPVPQKIKSKCHLHHLTLKDSFVEDDTGEYYCDVCEEERHPVDHVYCCVECHGHFVAHIECVLPLVSSSCSSMALL
ncbi:uncharacterized protein LOC111297390 [Durio zibethinus]|uniref:Uncharacterized protein LOC111297390 n=1 Tax=Durio zibethinus TaxID=66656 RepID=A0A6P5Z521_DURZI|nr:uncharacterized protein LOC111297390 [Durio zibethinus]